MNGYIDNSKYILVAQNLFNGKVEPISLNHIYQGNIKHDIAQIDLFSTKFENKKEMINWLYDNNYIEDKIVDLFIVHPKKYDGKKYIKEYELVYNKNNNRNSILVSSAQKRINQEKNISNEEVDDLLNKFITKIYYNKTFYLFMVCQWSMVDKYVIQKIMQSNNKSQIDYSIKYILKEKFSNYLVIRGIILMWNIYENLEKEYQKNNSNEPIDKWLIKKYIEYLNSKNTRKNNYEYLIEISDKNYIQGQITMTDYINNQSNSSYTNKMNEMAEEERKIKKAPFDNEILRKAESLNGSNNVLSSLNKDIVKTLTLEDQLRLGFIDYVSYKNEKRKEIINLGKIIH